MISHIMSSTSSMSRTKKALRKKVPGNTDKEKKK
jgi:hypothetical protein